MKQTTENNKNRSVILLTLGLCALFSTSALAFTCKISATGRTVDSGTANIHVNLTPSIGVGQNLIVDLSSQIECKNVAPLRGEHGCFAASTVFKPSLTPTPVSPDGPAARTVAHPPPSR